MKSWIVHYSNKYPGGRVSSHGQDLDVYDAEGNHRVAIRGGVDQSEELGCQDRHDLAPIPKNGRFMKLAKDGKIIRAEEHDERRPNAEGMAKGNGGKVPSIEELQAAGFTHGKEFSGPDDKPWQWSLRAPHGSSKKEAPKA
jgi:hypothetical protein